MIMSKETLIKSIREIPDFPIPGILFYDVTTLFKDPWCLQELSNIMFEMYKDKGITKVVGIESRGFIMGPILATRLNAGFIPIRKPGKLPAEVIEESYDKEYGTDTVQIHKDALDENDVVLLPDDLLAPGGTMKAKKVTAIILAGAICAAAFTGCGINTGATAASMKNQTVTMGMANFTCRYQQANVEDYYKSMMGAKSSSELWSKDLYGNGTTMEDTMKDSVMEQLHEMYTLQAHMKDYDVSVTKDEKAAIKRAAQQFISDNSSEALKEMTADEDTVEELLTLYTIRSKMQKAIEAEADTNVTDEEANERGYTMMTISTTSHQDDSGNTVEYTDDEKKQLKETANKIEDAVKNGKTLEDAAKDEDQQTTTGAYASDDSTLDTSVKKALDDLKEGETSDVIETDSALYIVRLDSETDKDATEKNRQNIIDKRKSDHYNEVLEGWQKKDGWKVNKKNVAKISFKNSLTQQDPNASTETQTSTETQNVESTQ